MRSLNELLIVVFISLVLVACTTTGFQWPQSPDEPDQAQQTRPAAQETEESPAASDERNEPARDRDVVIIERTVEPPPAKPDQQDILLEYASDYLALSPEAQREEFSRIESRYLDDPTEINLLRYALLTALANPPRREAENRVRSDLQSRRDGHAVLTEEDTLNTLSTFLLHLLETREQLLTQLTSQNQELQRKLDELKEIEQQLRERDSTQFIRTLP